IEEGIIQLTLPKMRFEITDNEGVTYINDAYNANPTSMRAAFEGVSAIKVKGKKIAVLGEMASLGSFSEECHREIGELASSIFDHLLAIGSEAMPLFESFQHSQKPAEFFLDHASLAQRLQVLARPGDLVLVKGSRSIELEKIFILDTDVTVAH
ncbi:MAG: UDP-N-acetylmuramoyl-tripeptide--D-alanyl-D-alanine ligase, partial [Chlamydiia bacterium]|nr:UDP-N-acetylmuramoyl-tripeptide--D-alanyl-D-alanine ligase [Chlamydiia bacterium]